MLDFNHQPKTASAMLVRHLAWLATRSLYEAPAAFRTPPIGTSVSCHDAPCAILLKGRNLNRGTASGAPPDTFAHPREASVLAYHYRLWRKSGFCRRRFWLGQARNQQPLAQVYKIAKADRVTADTGIKQL